MGARHNNEEEGKPMKQRISAEQLAELTLEQREKLKKWWIPTNSLFRSMLPAFFYFLKGGELF